MTLHLVVLLTTRPGLGHRQVEAFTRLAPVVRAEVGCLRYDLHPVEGEPDRFVLLEEWESAAHLAAHAASPHMREAGPEAAEFRAGPAELLRLGRLSPGDGKGGSAVGR